MFLVKHNFLCIEWNEIQCIERNDLFLNEKISTSVTLKQITFKKQGFYMPKIFLFHFVISFTEKNH